MVLTDKQRAVLNFIVAFRREHGCSPSIPELQREFGIRSPNGVVGHLRALEAKGLIRKGDRGSRQIEMTAGTEARERIHDLPVYGAIPAGQPYAAEPAPPARMTTVDEATLGFKPRPGTFVLEVRGDSMKDAGIFSGDLVVVEPSRQPKPGQIVAALVDGECTLKRLVRIKDRYVLKAENPSFADIHPRTSLSIQGVARAVIRRLA